MTEYLILKLQGPMQSWGSHTYEDYRPSNGFPTRSAVLGMLAACMGIDRADQKSQMALSNGLLVAVRQDDGKRENKTLPVVRLTDFHTVEKARKVDGKENKNPVVSRREYLCDASFTVGITITDGAGYSYEQIEKKLKSPVYTPFLGRRSCPMTRPLFETRLQADCFGDAFAKVQPFEGVFYSDLDEGADGQLQLRDVSLGRNRQFGTRAVYIHAGGNHVSQ
ncbi:MAG: type I-E CRISPR-associated protein Cas5/CasD [Gammaproteobacteria bacterium]|nr:MAG: type I-E CRISPR-associated protein Cas5/CasD [Gammaproteobacteria bacterium]